MPIFRYRGVPLTGITCMAWYTVSHARLSVQIEVPSRRSISKKHLVCLYQFGTIFFSDECLMFSTTVNILSKMRNSFETTFFEIYWFLKTAISRYHD